MKENTVFEGDLKVKGNISGCFDLKVIGNIICYNLDCVNLDCVNLDCVNLNCRNLDCRNLDCWNLDCWNIILCDKIKCKGEIKAKKLIKDRSKLEQKIWS